MKRVLTILLVLAITLLIVRANAQGRGNGAEGKGHKHGWKNDRHENHAHLDNCAIDHHHSVRTIAHPVKIYDHRPRRDHRHGGAHVRQEYVYYCDYDFYYDPERRVYISLSGGRWRVSASLPVHVRRSDLHRAIRHEVAYFGDDFPRYLTAGDRVAYVRR